MIYEALWVCPGYRYAQEKDGIIVPAGILADWDMSWDMPSGYRTEPGTYIDSFKTIHGCDSIHYTTLFVNPSYHKNNTYEICKGDTLYIGDQPICHAGTYYDSFTAMKGCDSIVISDVIVHPVYEHDFEHEICENDSIYLAGKYRKEPGRYTDSLKSSCECDSIAIHKLRVHPVYKSHLNYEICEGESMVLGGEKRTTTGVYYDTLMTEYGCKHIVESELIVYENPEIDLGEDTVISTLDTLILDAGPGFLTYYWNIGAPGQTIEVYNSQPASYEIIAEVTDFHYCKNADTLSVIIVSVDGVNEIPGDNILVFPNPANEYIVIQFTDPSQSGGNLVIYLIDMFGRQHHFKALDNQFNNTLYLKTKDLKRGIYTLCIENGSKMYTCKINITGL